MRRMWAVWLCWVAIGCQLDEGDLQRFETTARGPDKLAAVVRDDSFQAPLRAEAALSLLDLRRGDVDGSQLLLQTLEQLPQLDRSAVIGAVSQGMAARMEAPAGQPIPAGPLAHKNTAVALLKLSDGQAHQSMSDVLTAWLVKDFDGRAHAGSEDVDELADSLGATGVAGLVEALKPRASDATLKHASKLLDKHGDSDVRKAAARRMVEVDSAYRTDEQLQWLAVQTDRALRRQGALDAPAKLVREQAEGRRKHLMLDAVLPALGRFATEPVAASHLLALAGNGSGTVSEPERAAALQLLKSHVRPEDQQALLELALDDTQSPQLRRHAVLRVGELADRSALPSVVALMRDRDNGALRQAAGELLLRVGGPDALLTFFRSLPAFWNTDYTRAELSAYSELINAFEPEQSTVLLMAAKLHSKRWWARVLALHYFAAQGAKEDVWRIRQHVHDLLPVRGPDWPRGHTVGQEAQEAVTAALRRHNLPGTGAVLPSKKPGA